MELDFLVGGMPRGGTTVAAKFMSLHPDMFGYAGETHLIPNMHSMFGNLPCRSDKIDLVVKYLHKSFMTCMIEMPQFNVRQGAHPANLIFEKRDVDDLVDFVHAHLKNKLYGEDLYGASLIMLRELLAKVDDRIILGEKTPDNIFAMAKYSMSFPTKNIVVMREPIGVLRSMKERVKRADPYSGCFKGDLETNIGMYIEYAMAAKEILKSTKDNLLVRFEDMAQSPSIVVRDMFDIFDRSPENDVIKFVETAQGNDIADRAPMFYRRLNLKSSYEELSPVDVWKIYNFTRDVRKVFGYSDEAMTEFGFDIPSEWPEVEVPPKILPLYGFHKADLIGKCWMKRKGGVVAYLGRERKHEVILELTSEFPEQVQDEVELLVSVNGIRFDELKIKTGSQSTLINLNIHSDELIPMGNKGGYAIIDLISSMSYSPIGQISGSNDAREMSFQLKSWKINRKKFRFWWN